MKYGMVTVQRNDIGGFEEYLPEYVLDNCGKQGCLMIGAVDPDYNLVGITQFYIGMLEDGTIVSDVVYVYVNEDKRRNGIASRMLSKVHSIVGKSGIDKSLTFMDEKKEEKELFKGNGYMFMKIEEESVRELGEVHEKIVPAMMEQGVCWVE